MNHHSFKSSVPKNPTINPKSLPSSSPTYPQKFPRNKYIYTLKKEEPAPTITSHHDSSTHLQSTLQRPSSTALSGLNIQHLLHRSITRADTSQKLHGSAAGGQAADVAFGVALAQCETGA
ncbi:hypothetical protein HYFRA_00005355 [Hymenoscyphus fraxineus]|uniref:Uncharacterized protein n=1 Tax=Hymenoscyphus fraxineus TaxID=746836 RepID=A0A9N9Q0B5_9HELO|nr:hypothetical protein HYFRA_00005355 [Hymenoscyphus fraxineus]